MQGNDLLLQYFFHCLNSPNFWIAFQIYKDYQLHDWHLNLVNCIVYLENFTYILPSAIFPREKINIISEHRLCNLNSVFTRKVLNVFIKTQNTVLRLTEKESVYEKLLKISWIDPLLRIWPNDWTAEFFFFFLFSWKSFCLVLFFY